MRLLLLCLIGTALLVWWIGSSPSELPVAAATSAGPGATQDPHDRAGASSAGEAAQRRRVAPAPDFPGLLDRLHDRAERGAALEQALHQTGMAAWVLARLEAADFPSPRKRELGWALRAVLTVWQDLPVAPELDREAYLRRVAAAGARHDRPAAAIAFAWRQQRLLHDGHLGLVQGVRPDRIDGIGAGQPGAGRASMFLALLEDVLRAKLELGQDQPVLARLEDPSAEVRMLARRLWFETERSGGWMAALAGLDALDHAEQLDLLRAIASLAEPELALEALRQAEFRAGERQGYLGAWVDLGGRRPNLVGGLYAELLEARQWAVLPEGDYLADPALDPDGYQELEDVFREGRGRSNLLTAYLVSAEHSGGVDWALLADSSLQEWNPLVRGTAWSALAGNGQPEGQQAAFQHLLDPSWRSAARIPGVDTDEHLMPGLRELAAGLPADALPEYQRTLGDFRLGEAASAELDRLIQDRLAEGRDM